MPFLTFKKSRFLNFSLTFFRRMLESTMQRHVLDLTKHHQRHYQLYLWLCVAGLIIHFVYYSDIGMALAGSSAVWIIMDLYIDIRPKLKYLWPYW